MRSLWIAVLLLSCRGGLVAHGQNVAVSKLALMTFEGRMEVNASAVLVWAALTDADKVQRWCPYWKKGRALHSLDTVGQTIPYVDSWGNGGQSVVLFVDKGRELRIAHVPDDGSYVCQVKFQLEPRGAATVVSVTEQYGDQMDVPVDRDTAARTRQEITEYMTALKKLAEKPAGTR